MIDWIQLRKPPQNILLKPIYEDIIRRLSLFDVVTFHHIYRAHNMIADQLSKMGLLLMDGLV